MNKIDPIGIGSHDLDRKGRSYFFPIQEHRYIFLSARKVQFRMDHIEVNTLQ